MSVELGSVWIDNDSDLLVIVKSLEAKFDGKVTVIFNYIVRTGDKSIESASELELFLNTKTKLVRYAEKGNVNNKDDQNLNYRMGYNDGWHDCEASFELGNEFTDNIQEQAYDEGYVEGYNQHEYEMHQVMSEREFEGIIDEAFEEGYAQAHSEIQSKNERERALQEKAWDEGYSQAIDDLIEAGVIGEDEEDYLDEEYSEYEFGTVEDGEEEYCFSKELDRILNSAFVADTNYNVNSKESINGDYKLVGISGLARSGKDVAGEIILENLGEGWARGAFADIPKEMLFVMGVDTKHSNKDGEDDYYQYNIRHLMQSLGTDWGRNIDNDIWIKAFKKKNPTGNFVITDVRMENEADFVRDNGGVIVHVKGRGGIKGNHQSEAGIEIKRGDLLVFNDSDLANFEKEVSNICKTLVKRI